MTSLEQVKGILGTVLQLGERANKLTAASSLIGGIPEFDSMAVVAVLTAIEEHFGIVVDDDELSAQTFATVGSLAEFVSAKTASA